MAKKAKAATLQAKKEKGLGRDDFMKLVGEANRQGEISAEYASNASTIVRNGIERLGLDKKAFGFARSVQKMEPVRQQATAAAVVKYLAFVGAFDQADAFSDVLDDLRSLIADLEARDGPTEPASAGALDELTGATVN
jgi:hypothetical protein